MVLAHTQKDSRRFDYYTNHYETVGGSMAPRISAFESENIVVDQLSQTRASGSRMQSMSLDGRYTSEQLHDVVSQFGDLATDISSAN